MSDILRRRTSIPVHVGDVRIGGGGPVVVQSMTTTNTADVAATSAQIGRLADLGCQIVRVAVPDREAALALPELLKNSPVPLISDIHFDHRLALLAAEANIDGLRINPGNIGDRDRVRQVVSACKERDIPIRIGVNAGSIPENRTPDGRPKQGQALAEAMVAHAMSHIKILEDENFEAIKVSLKAFDIDPMVRAYRLIADQMPYPLHLGITEAGTVRSGSIRSAIGIGMLLYEGIGDTIRVSLTAEPEEEVPVAYEILKSLELHQQGTTLVSCPSCGRCEIELFDLVEQVEQHPFANRRTAEGRGHGLRGQRPGRGARRRHRAGRRSRSRGHLLQGRDPEDPGRGRIFPELTTGIDELVAERRRQRELEEAEA